MKEVVELQKNLIASIKHEMFRHQLDVPDLAAALGMSTSGVYKILSGVMASIDFSHLEKLAKLFRTTPAQMLGGAMARDAPTLQEALEIIKAEVARVQGMPNLAAVPRELLLALSTAGADEFEAVKIALEGTAIGKEAAHVIRKGRGKDKQSSGKG